MNSPPKPPNTINSRGHPTEFEPIIQAKSHNFIGREFVFTAIHEFLHRYRQGYFTITAHPVAVKVQFSPNMPQIILMLSITTLNLRVKIALRNLLAIFAPN